MRVGFALLLALDLLAVGAIGEIWTRLAIPVKRICWTFDPRLGPIFCPNQERISYVEGTYSNVFRTNSLGFHDVERRPEAPPGTYRIHVYGDSMIVGGNVPMDKTIPAVAERLLDRLGDGSVEVLNMALLDSTSSAFVTYQEVGSSFTPDMVVLNFMDDFPDNLMSIHRRPHHPHHRFDEQGRLIEVPPIAKNLATPWERFKQLSRLYRLLANKLLESRLYYRGRQLGRELRFRLSQDRAAATSPAADSEAERRRLLIEQSWPLTLEIIRAFQARVEADGARFVLSDGRWLYERNVATVYSNRDIESFCREQGIAYIPTYEALGRLEDEPDRSRFFLRDNHPTALGNEILGRFLAERLSDLIDPPIEDGPKS